MNALFTLGPLDLDDPRRDPVRARTAGARHFPHVVRHGGGRHRSRSLSPSMSLAVAAVWFCGLSLAAVLSRELSAAEPIGRANGRCSMSARCSYRPVLDLVDPIVNGRGSIKTGDSIWRVEGPELPKGAGSSARRRRHAAESDAGGASRGSAVGLCRAARLVASCGRFRLALDAHRPRPPLASTASPRSSRPRAEYPRSHRPWATDVA